MSPPLPSFDRLGPAEPISPVVLSVPHAGRDYPLALRAGLRVPLAALRPLEDRLVDTVAEAARGTATTFIARRPRAWIDLNRAEHERDPRVDDGASSMLAPLASSKVRSGLGLVPRRASGVNDIWLRRLAGHEVEARIADDHRPYHLALTDALRAARARYGIAVLLDLHSMPPIAGGGGPRIVIGDRFGRSAAGRFVARVEDAARARGWPTGINAPYPGGHILDRHGAPGRGIHAIQLELDRRLYLDLALDGPGPGLAETVAFVGDVIDGLSDEAAPQAIAAE